VGSSTELQLCAADALCLLQRSQLPLAATPFRERVGVAILPGSERVWDRSTRSMTTCSEQLCLHSQPEPDQVTSSVQRRAPLNGVPPPGN
jgi:hypothetical protein